MSTAAAAVSTVTPFNDPSRRKRLLKVVGWIVGITVLLVVLNLLGVDVWGWIKKLWDSKGSALIDVMEPKTMRAYAVLCGQTLARAHARSGDAVAISSYLGTSDSFDRALATFAEAYADQNERDYAALKAAADSGRIEVQTGL